MSVFTKIVRSHLSGRFLNIMVFSPELVLSHQLGNISNTLQLNSIHGHMVWRFYDLSMAGYSLYIPMWSLWPCFLNYLYFHPFISVLLFLCVLLVVLRFTIAAWSIVMCFYHGMYSQCKSLFSLQVCVSSWMNVLITACIPVVGIYSPHDCVCFSIAQ